MMRNCGYLRRTMASTCKPSILGMRRSVISRVKGSDSSSAMARAPELETVTSGWLGSCWSNSWYNSSICSSSSSSSNLWRGAIVRFVGYKLIERNCKQSSRQIF